MKHTLLAFMCLLTLAGCNAYFVPSLGILRENGGVFCWTPNGSERPESCQNKAASTSLYECTQELRPISTLHTTLESAQGQVLHCMERKGWRRTLIAGEVVILAQSCLTVCPSGPLRVGCVRLQLLSAAVA